MPYQQSTTWWSSLFSGPANGEALLPPKIPAAGRAVSKTPHPAVARIIVPERRSAALGSGTLIAKTAQHGYLITNWHVVREARDGALVVFANGTQAQGKIVRTDKDWDLALVQIPAPAAEPLSISATVPQVGEQLWIAGYGSGEFLLQAGLCSQYLAPYPNWPLELVEVGAAARQGDSGGPILNSRGELAGVLFGQGDGYTMGAYGGRVLQFLNQLPDTDSLTRGTIAQLAAARTESIPATNTIAANPQAIPSPLQVGAILVSNSPEKSPEQRYWLPERRQSSSQPESISQPPTPNLAVIDSPASPTLADTLAMRASVQPSSAAPLAMYSLPKTPPTTPAVSSQYKPSPEPFPQNSFAESPTGYGLVPESNPATSVLLPPPPVADQHLSFEEFAGRTPLDQAITGLWCLGGIYLLFKICGWLTRSGSRTPAKKSTAKRVVIRKPVPKPVAARVQKNDLNSYDDDEDEEEDDEDDE